jgi:hypothetical protein
MAIKSKVPANQDPDEEDENVVGDEGQFNSPERNSL